MIVIIFSTKLISLSRIICTCIIIMLIGRKKGKGLRGKIRENEKCQGRSIMKVYELT